MTMPVNNPTTPTVDGVNPAIPADEDCEAIKIRFGIESDTHRRNTSGSTKKSSRSYQSHHIFQDAGLKDIIPRKEACAVMLANSHRGTEHGTITANQNSRRNNKKYGRGGTMPGATYGEVKKQARDDLVEGIEGKRKDKNTGKPATKEEAERLADCLVAEADKAIQDQAEQDDKEITDSTPVKQPGGCFVPGTIVWLEQTQRAVIERLPPDAFIDAPTGRARILRVDECHHTTVSIDVDGRPAIELAAYHRLQTSDGRLVRADDILVGEELAAHGGTARVTGVTRHAKPRRLYSFGVGHAARCQVGALGLWVELVDSGLEQSRSDLVSAFAGMLQCRL